MEDRRLKEIGRFGGFTMRGFCSFLVAPAIIACLSSWTATTTLADPRATVVREFCNKTIADGPGAVWADNFIVAFDNVNSDLEQKGWGITSVGKDPITYYGLVQCLEDLSKEDCTLCYSEIRSLLPKCYPGIGGRIYLDGCFMRYANYSFFDEFLDSLDTSVCSSSNRSSGQQGFSSAVSAVLSNVTSLAVKSNKGFAVSSASRSPQVAAYALAQCWQNLNTSSCAACLSAAAASVAKCAPAEEGRALFAGCFIRYSTAPFWNSKDSASSVSSRKRVVLWTVLSSSVGVILVLVISVLAWKRNKARKARDRSLRGLYGSELPASMSHSSLNFSYKDLKKGTSGFSLENKLGQGSNGTVYKAVLHGRNEVAAKRLFLNTKQCIDQFFNEVDVISQVRHKNLVKLLGCSVDGPESFLIYEYHSNRSLDLFIFGGDQSMHLDWQQRFDVIQGIAEGLCYLHEESETRIIHRDIKASNVLLDQKLKPKITDFGLARVLCGDRTHLTTGIAGTVGYMAPEYVVHGHLTEKADVYSFGVLVIEIVTGKRCGGSTGSHSGHSLLAEVWHSYKANTTEKAVDAKLQREQAALEEITRVVQVGLLCAQANPGERPAMSRVVELLRDRDGARGDAGFVLGDPPFFEVDVAGGGGETSTLLPCNPTSGEVSGTYSELSAR
ncbi:cysteine-rich receptor-like protein kinase 2 isoform X3 [Phragmites australis]|uniref:cysteine-rich receptor-like protein kinase 2 isoform X3 n=1 Tax=Phragmites australis TaxID=29695 RepID=UPI002D79D64A|nr:cysteine-rich receptor-like protein kinase 2 isoform X3 [Phragmites australis]